MNRPGWTANNSIALLITGSGERTAESFDGVAAAAPLLHIEYLLPTVSDPVAFDVPADADPNPDQIFENLKGDLKIKPVKVGFAAFYESLGRVDLMENHDGEAPVFISGKKVRELLQNGEQVDPRIMRPGTSEILSAAMVSA